MLGCPTVVHSGKQIGLRGSLDFLQWRLSWLQWYTFGRSVLFCASLVAHTKNVQFRFGDSTAWHKAAPVPAAYLHVLIPASHPDANLCKTLLSAAILGYPTPTIINWNKTFDDPNLVEGGSHLAKISGVKDYIQALGSARDDDLILMIDGYDMWLQLRPQTLLDRYFEINNRANSRIKEELGATAEKNNIHQDIVFSAQKRCWPWTIDDPPCYAVPESSLPRDIYGSQTDTDIGNTDNPYIKYRQRFLNSGVGIGTVAAMRKMFEEAVVRAKADPWIGSDQRIFSHIFGDQEIYREVLRQEQMSSKMFSWFSSDTKRFNETHVREVSIKAAARKDKSLEFGIGLDYAAELGLPTVFAEDDTAWVRYDRPDRITKLSLDMGVTRVHTSLAEDIADTLPPFWTYSTEPSLPRERTWDNASLFTNLWTGVTPAAIHHNAHRNGMKNLRTKWWSNIWFQRYARVLYDAHIYNPVVPVAEAGYDDTSRRVYWSPELWKGGARSGAGNGNMKSPWLRYDEICRGTEDEVFRDGKGPWQLPADH